MDETNVLFWALLGIGIQIVVLYNIIRLAVRSALRPRNESKSRRES